MTNAGWNPDRASLPGTHTALIGDIIRWIPGTASVAESQVERIYVLFGPPHCGKSSVAHTIAQTFREEGRLGSAIFLDQEVEDRNNSRKIFTTMAYDLAMFDSKIKEAISSAIGTDRGRLSADIKRQFRELIVDPIRHLTVIGPVLILIDGVDNLPDAMDRLRFLHVLLQESIQLPPNFRIIITARSTDEVEAAFPRLNYYRRHEMVSSDLGDVRTRLAEATSKLNVNSFGQHSIDAVQEQLMQRAMEIDLWLTMTSNFLITTSESDATIFVKLLLLRPLPQTPPDAMDQLYDALLQTISTTSHALFETGWQGFFQALMNGKCASILAAKSHIPAVVTHDRDPVDVLQTVGCIVLDVPNDGICAVRLHPSFQAFITDNRRCTDDRFYVDMAVHYASIPELALEAMNRLIVHNICRLEDTSLLNSEVSDMEDRIHRFVSATLLYAVRHWADHLPNVKLSEGRVLEHLRAFLFQHLLHWIELSSATGQVDAALASLKTLLKWLTVCIVYFHG
jgi:hypothetical protein